jgi:hypothetical protein
MRLLDVASADYRAEPKIGAVRQVDRLFLGLKGVDRCYWPEEFLLGDRRLGRKSDQHGRRVEIARTSWDLAARYPGGVLSGKPMMNPFAIGHS